MRSDNARLCVLDGTTAGETFPLGPDRRVIGRGATMGSGRWCTIRIPDLSVSPAHAFITFDAEQVAHFVTDTGSANGSALERGTGPLQCEIGRAYRLEDGDVIRFGVVRCRFEQSRLER